MKEDAAGGRGARRWRGGEGGGVVWRGQRRRFVCFVVVAATRAGRGRPRLLAGHVAAVGCMVCWRIHRAGQHRPASPPLGVYPAPARRRHGTAAGLRARAAVTESRLAVAVTAVGGRSRGGRCGWRPDRVTGIVWSWAGGGGGDSQTPCRGGEDVGGGNGSRPMSEKEYRRIHEARLPSPPPAQSHPTPCLLCCEARTGCRESAHAPIAPRLRQLPWRVLSLCARSSARHNSVAVVLTELMDPVAICGTCSVEAGARHSSSTAAGVANDTTHPGAGHARVNVFFVARTPWP